MFHSANRVVLHVLRRLSTAIVMLAVMLQVAASANAQSSDLDQKVELVFSQMPVEDRVGQLFLVTYYGSNLDSDSEIMRLVKLYRVGGVVISVQNDNFNDSASLPEQTYAISSRLQTALADRTPSQSGSVPPVASRPGPYVPLFVGVEQGVPTGKFQNTLPGLTNVPSSMALGATWDPLLAEATGSIVGQDLSALGVNLLLGPSADVVEVPQPFVSGDLGTQVFGGEPYWVSKFASAYVKGVHVGSLGHVAVVARHFPGHGAADRVASVEVPTIRRSLDQLAQFDLIPFFVITGQAPDALSSVDGLTTGHISYRGFQGDNPRVQTRPISLDQQALQALLKLDSIATWRSNGGLLITDSLGQVGVRRLYELQDGIFPNRRIAQDALLAGNDMLYLHEFGVDPRSDQTATVVDTIDYFVQSYDRDPAFKSRVDDAVRRILKKKLALYDNWNLQSGVVPPKVGILTVGNQTEETFRVAQNAITLISPSIPDGLSSPRSGDRVVIFTDVRAVSLCSICIERPAIAVNDLQLAITRLYGPQGSAVGLDSIQSYSFQQLANYLQVGPQFSGGADATPIPDNLTVALRTADWIVFVMQDVTPGVYGSDVVKQFLAVPPVAADTQIVVMAMGAPYYLDSTEVSKLAAYYALYDSSQAFVDVAARALFAGASFAGSSPVSISGIGYNILDVTLPSAEQVIKLNLQADTKVASALATQTATPDLNLRLNDKVIISTGIIIDKNGHPVPDGTPVEFVLNYTTQSLRDTIPATTQSGIASASLLLTKVGELKVTAQANEARQSDTVTITISDTGPATISVESPDVSPTPPPLPTSTPEITATPAGGEPQPTPKRVTFRDLMIAVFGLTIIGAGAFSFGRARRGMNFGLMLALPGLILGLVGYNYYSLLMPGANAWRGLVSDFWGAATATWALAVIGVGFAWVLINRSDRGVSLLLTRRDRRQNKSGQKSDKK